MANHITYSRDQYEGHENEKIISLHSELEDNISERKRIENDIYEIQSKCIHQYMFSSQGMYEDNYVCRLCGHESEK